MSRSEQIFQVMKDGFETISKSVLPEASDASIKLRVVAVQLATLFDKLDFYEQQIYPQTATGEYLMKHGTARGIYKKDATCAKGQVLFTLQTGLTHDVTIPKGTLCASSKNSNILFQTTADITISQGTTTGIAWVESTETGTNTAIAAGYLDILVAPINGVKSVKNPYRIEGGTDTESDESYRRRVIESYQKISNGANLNYYEVFAKSKSDIWHAKAIFETGVTNKIKLYVENATRTISDQTIQALQTDMEQARELGVQVLVSRPTVKKISLGLTVYVDNLKDEPDYYFSAGKAITAYLQALDIGQRFSPNHAAREILEIPGVLDVSFTLPTTSIIPNANEIISLEHVDLTILKGKING